ncbi:HAD family hydrolase [Brevibacterium casei]|uniref:HAD family hydrolase n=1 Tax=Brevibacterium casei TaxID=33889 RepID=UPI001CE68DBA|nr:HAD family hydrolase [Brevibacterium casei]MDH5150203.1 HAD family hydrolase [Brevibacterium casei]QZE25447.1 HAD family hydrolase [Brevibacterium casei]
MSGHRRLPADFDLGLVASDIDGTLLLDWQPISEATIDAIHRCQREGIPFVLVTGRPIRWLAPIAEQIPDLGRVVCLNGAVVYDIASESVVDAHTLGHAEVVEIVSAISGEHPEAHFAFETLTGLFIDDGFATRCPRDATVIGDIGEIADRDVVKILVSLGTEDSAALHDLLGPLVTRSCHATFSDPVNGLVELAPRGITKAKTLESVCDHLGVGQEQVMAFGDMPNDIEMLSWAGHGVAMGNALDIVKESADAVTDAVEDDGVAHYLTAMLDALPAR